MNRKETITTQAEKITAGCLKLLASEIPLLHRRVRNQDPGKNGQPRLLKNYFNSVLEIRQTMKNYKRLVGRRQSIVKEQLVHAIGDLRGDKKVCFLG